MTNAGSLPASDDDPVAGLDARAASRAASRPDRRASSPYVDARSGATSGRRGPGACSHPAGATAPRFTAPGGYGRASVGPSVWVGRISRTHGAWQIWSLKDRAARCRYLAHAASAGRRSAGGWETSLRRSTDRTRPRSGVPVAGVGVWSSRGLPERSRNVASQPAPKRPHCGRTPNLFSGSARLSGGRCFVARLVSDHPERELEDRRRAGSATSSATRIRLVPGLTPGLPPAQADRRLPARRRTPAPTVRWRA